MAAPKTKKRPAQKYTPGLGFDVQNIVVCCDGSWCGEMTGTTSNIKILANSFAGENVASKIPAYNAGTKSVVCFFDGMGASSTQIGFGDYLMDGALAITIQERCLEAYEFIAEHFQPGRKVYLFGLSRGAHTVRSVAAMINNFGIIIFSDKESCKEESKRVYNNYCDKDPDLEPDSPFSACFKADKSHPTEEPPVRFLGLLDTVGALGVPQLRPGAGPTYELYDQVVSWQVQTVCQALAVHDRMSLFKPCYVARSSFDDPRPMPYSDYPRSKYETSEVWFPGSHYDIGRQRLVFARKGKWGWEALLHNIQNYTNLLQLNVTYTPSLANPPVIWMINKVKRADESLLPQDASYYLTQWAEDSLPESFLPRFPETYTDAYDKLYTKLVPNLLRWLPVIGSWIRVILNAQLLRDRFIPQVPMEPPVFFFRDRTMPETQAINEYNKYNSNTFRDFYNTNLRGLRWVDCTSDHDSGKP